MSTRVPALTLEACLEHVPEKWKPVFRKGHATTKRSTEMRSRSRLGRPRIRNRALRKRTLKFKRPYYCLRAHDELTRCRPREPRSNARSPDHSVVIRRRIGFGMKSASGPTIKFLAPAKTKTQSPLPV